MISRVFLDSSVLVEALKGNKVEFYQKVVIDIENECCINETVVSEYLYHVLAFLGGASPRAIQEKKFIASTLDVNPLLPAILTEFTFLTCDPSIGSLIPTFMKQYNLLPNDAIILATCKLHGITKLASHDTDFVVCCREEGIELLTE